MPGRYFGSTLSSFGTEFRNGDFCFSATFPPPVLLHGDSCKGQLAKFSCSSNTIDWVALVQPMRDQLSFGLNLTHWFSWLNPLTFVFVLVHPQQLADPVRCVVGIIWRLILVSIYLKKNTHKQACKEGKYLLCYISVKVIFLPRLECTNTWSHPPVSSISSPPCQVHHNTRSISGTTVWLLEALCLI